MPREQLPTIEEHYLRVMRVLFGTPKHAHTRLGLEGAVEFPNFYRIWNGRGGTERHLAVVRRHVNVWRKRFLRDDRLGDDETYTLRAEEVAPPGTSQADYEASR